MSGVDTLGGPIDYPAEAALVRLSMKARPGELVALSETEASGPFKLMHDVFYEGSIRQGRRFVDVNVSKSRIGKIELGVHQGEMSGYIWGFEGERDVMLAKLRHFMRELALHEIDKIRITIESLGQERSANPGGRDPR